MSSAQRDVGIPNLASTLHEDLNMIAIIATSDQPYWLAEACKIILLQVSEMILVMQAIHFSLMVSTLSTVLRDRVLAGLGLHDHGSWQPRSLLPLSSSASKPVCSNCTVQLGSVSAATVKASTSLAIIQVAAVQLQVAAAAQSVQCCCADHAQIPL